MKRFKITFLGVNGKTLKPIIEAETKQLAEDYFKFQYKFVVIFRIKEVKNK